MCSRLPKKGMTKQTGEEGGIPRRFQLASTRICRFHGFFPKAHLARSETWYLTGLNPDPKWISIRKKHLFFSKLKLSKAKTKDHHKKKGKEGCIKGKDYPSSHNPNTKQLDKIAPTEKWEPGHQWRSGWSVAGQFAQVVSQNWEHPSYGGAPLQNHQWISFIPKKVLLGQPQKYTKNNI